jgi:hypothetical protein
MIPVVPERRVINERTTAMMDAVVTVLPDNMTIK